MTGALLGHQRRLPNGISPSASGGVHQVAVDRPSLSVAGMLVLKQVLLRWFRRHSLSPSWGVCLPTPETRTYGGCR